ncbi:S41 family peptidase [Flavobacterium psychrotrophum]|uniref:S41 family peptidase n=1 Tax=Flavobacterium psychrotrophum TaxID=2294119 RepID=UPI000E315863|nr:S41 family peptidase [Flavobacterium psychrotrophum]
MKKALQLCIFLMTLVTVAQDCPCSESFNWAKKTFEENDAGFQYVIDKKGAEAYRQHNAIFADKVKTITTKEDCAAAVYEWLKFFRGGHISANAVNNVAAPTAAVDSHTDWEKYPVTEKQFLKYLAKADPKSLEGIWKTTPYTIGIIKKGDGYIGFILDGAGTAWQKNQIKLRAKPNADKTGYNGEFYLRNYQTYKFENARLIGANTILLGRFIFQRDNPKVQDVQALKNYVALLGSDGPMVQQHSANTLVLRIPSFDGGYKKDIDSVIRANHDKIIRTKNLVIDVRNNGGGSDGSYREIVKYLYTNPIRIVATQMYSTKLNNERMEGFLKEPGISEAEKAEITAELKKLNDNPGKFVNLHEQKVFVQTLDTVYNYPENVAILINENNASTTEQFLLAAKQSSKTKLFGTTTAGMLDISNMHFVISPCGTLQLGYCLSKSFRIPHMAIDDIGLQPDYYLDSEIPDEEWVNYAEKTFSTIK